MLSPKTPEKPFKEKIHGITIYDPYRWLEGEGKKVSSWIKTQNKFSRGILDRLPLRRFFTKRLSELTKIDTIGVPFPRNGFYFLQERKANQDLSVLYVQKGLKGKKRVLIDQNKLSKGKTTTLTQWAVSKNARFLVYALSKSGNDQSSIHVLDVKTGRNLQDYIPAKFYPGQIEWNPDGTGFWYSRRHGKAKKGEEKLNQKIFYHCLGDNFKKDQLVFGAALAKDQYPGAIVSEDGNYLFAVVRINSGKVRKNEVYVQDLSKPGAGFKPVVRGLDAEFSLYPHRSDLFIHTNYKAPNWRIIKVSFAKAHLGIKHWKTIIAEQKYPIEDFALASDALIVNYSENAHSAVRVYDLDGKIKNTLPLEVGTVGGFNFEPEGKEIFFRFTSFAIPTSVYRIDLNNLRTKLFAELKIKGLNLKQFQTKQVWYKSKDGIRVPMFLVYKKGMRRNGKNPTLLYGYGGFGISRTPGFNPPTLAFLEKGGIYALANLRGGGEFGEKWHQAGTKEKKQNVFDDFIAAAEWLIRRKYTDRDQLAIFGWSNGGLLTGAMLAQRPDLFKAAVVGAPVIDMLRFHKFHGGRYWISDYGNPDKPKDLKYLLKYSPYHNLRDGISYPSVLIVTAEGDDRVHPSHAYKFTARLQKANASQNPILLTVERKAGHSGAQAVSSWIEQYADIYGFIGWQLGMR